MGIYTKIQNGSRMGHRKEAQRSVFFSIRDQTRMPFFVESGAGPTFFKKVYPDGEFLLSFSSVMPSRCESLHIIIEAEGNKNGSFFLERGLLYLKKRSKRNKIDFRSR